MCTTCNHQRTSGADNLPAVQTANLADLTALSIRNSARLRTLNVAVADSALASSSAVHTTDGGGVFVTTTSLGNLQGNVSLSGTIGPFPVELHLSVTLADDTVTVTLEIDKPIHLGPYTWTFKLGGVVRNAQNVIIGAQTVSLSPDTPAIEAAAIGSTLLCILKCAGTTILPILLECVPSIFTGGGAGFIACVIGKAGSAAAGIAACVAKCIG
jgi:hypothetical protein